MPTTPSRSALLRAGDRTWRWPLMSQTRRRVAVGVMYLGALGVLVVLWAGAEDAISERARWLAILPGIVGLLGFAGICMTATRASWGRVALDERDTSVRDHAYRRSYWIAITVVALGLVYAMLAADRSGWWHPETADAYGAILAGYLFLIGSLPTAIVAWTESDVEIDGDCDVDILDS